MTAEICPTCDRHFQTTGNMKAQAPAMVNPSWATANPYTYGQGGDFQPMAASNQLLDVEPSAVQYGPIILAAIGLGWLAMMMNHQFTKGLLVLGLYMLTFGIVTIGHVPPAAGLMTYLLVGVGGYVVSLIDVYCISHKYARGETVREWEWF